MTSPARSNTPPPAVDPSRITVMCANDLHSRCRGRVTVYNAAGRQHFEACQCQAKNCTHGPRPRRRRKQ